MNNILQPFYLVDFTSSICNFEIYINDMPVFLHYDEGSLSTHYPINHFILESGIQNIRIRVIPLKEENFLRKEASLRIKIYFYDNYDNSYQNLIQVFEFITPDLSEQEMPLLEFKGNFQAEVPYELIGWKKSIILAEDKLQIKQAMNFYKKIYSLFENKNYQEINALQNKKYKEIDTALYIKNADNLLEWMQVIEEINISKMLLQEFPLSLVPIFYAEGKVINLTRKDGSPILHFKNENNEEFSFPTLIHKKSMDSEFEIIR
ncbi:hypothetical protein ETU08_03305 [Apibacter muscae]|uniref:hypothetical protein n=1 Tax=Apibacter muscae TaxID=2509004 RepID=UPI0011ABAB40|nr:hypothetical protein [Apibacter muscae]TWP31048.1 hypothetical protein ETU08_03305 [Apibacter muscae]